MVHGVLKLVDLVELRQNQLAIRFLQSIEQTFLPIESPMFSCRWPDPLSFAQWGQQFADPAAWLDQIGVIWIVMLLGITIVVVDLNKGFMQHYTPSSVLELLMGEDAAATAAELLPLITPRLSSSLRVREVAMVVEADRHFRSSCDPTPAPPIPSTRVDALQREVIRLRKQLVRAKAMRLPPVARLALAYVRNEYQMRQILRSAGLMAEGRGQEGTHGKDHEPPTPPMRGQVVHLEEPRRGVGPRGRVDHAHYLRALEMQVDTGLSFNAIPKALKGSFAVMAPGQQLEVSIPCARSYGRASEDIALTVTEGQARKSKLYNRAGYNTDLYWVLDHISIEFRKDPLPGIPLLTAKQVWIVVHPIIIEIRRYYTERMSFMAKMPYSFAQLGDTDVSSRRHAARLVFEQLPQDETASRLQLLYTALSGHLTPGVEQHLAEVYRAVPITNAGCETALKPLSSSRVDRMGAAQVVAHVKAHTEPLHTWHHYITEASLAANRAAKRRRMADGKVNPLLLVATPPNTAGPLLLAATGGAETPNPSHATRVAAQAGSTRKLQEQKRREKRAAAELSITMEFASTDTRQQYQATAVEQQQAAKEQASNRARMAKQQIQAIAMYRSTIQPLPEKTKQATRTLPKLTLRPEVLRLYLASSTWVLGTGLDLLGAVLMIAAFAQAPVSVVQPVSAVGLVILLIFSHFYLKERLRPAEWLSACIAFAGVLGLGVSSEPEHLEHPDHLHPFRIVMVFLAMLAMLGKRVNTSHPPHSRAESLSHLTHLGHTVEGVDAAGEAAAAGGPEGGQQQSGPYPHNHQAGVPGGIASQAAAAAATDAVLCGLEGGACFGFSAAACRTGFILARRVSLVWAPLGLLSSVLLTSSGFMLQTRGLKAGSTVVVCTMAAVASMVTGVLAGLLALGEALPSTHAMRLARLASWLAILLGVSSLAGGPDGLATAGRAVAALVTARLPPPPPWVWRVLPLPVAQLMRRAGKRIGAAAGAHHEVHGGVLLPVSHSPGH
ncbi:hypothetical protein QJQ45_002366 [Haematococcus lacustris]|nr:hypothetical protein QJQ45_002366 [Haematococcus lacustris]